MLFGHALTRSGLDAEELHACASTTFRRQAATATSVLGDDPDLYLDIQRLNPHRDEVYAATTEALGDLVRMVAENDREGFRQTLGVARRVLDRSE
jgi:chorismate mutase/prephenate dehydrogenase